MNLHIDDDVIFTWRSQPRLVSPIWWGQSRWIEYNIYCRQSRMYNFVKKIISERHGRITFGRQLPAVMSWSVGCGNYMRHHTDTTELFYQRHLADSESHTNRPLNFARGTHAFDLAGFWLCKSSHNYEPCFVDISPGFYCNIYQNNLHRIKYSNRSYFMLQRRV